MHTTSIRTKPLDSFMVLGLATVLAAGCSSYSGTSAPSDGSDAFHRDAGGADTADTGPDGAADGRSDGTDGGDTSPDIRRRACREEVDRENDGTIDEISLLEYNVGGNLSKKKVDEGNDGSIDELRIFVFDAQERRARQKVDRGNDGTIDQVSIYNYEGDQLATVEVDDGNDGSIDDVHRLEYANGKLTKKTIDVGNDGQDDIEITYVRTGEGKDRHLTKQVVDTDLDGEADRENRFEYDEHGRRTKLKIDRRADGSVDTTVTYVYEDCEGGPSG